MWQKEIVKIHAVFGGKNPHPNYLVGGVPCSINMNEVAAINSERLNLVSKLIDQADEFINQVYIPDVLAVASFYKDWAKYGGGLTNYMSYGEFPTKGYGQVESFKYPRGVVLGRDLSAVHAVNAVDPREIKEYIAHSWYSYDGGDKEGIHPWAGETNLNYTGPKPPFETLEGLREVFVPEDSALERPGNGGWATGTADRRLCFRQRPGKRPGGRDAGQAERSGGRALLHAGTGCGTRAGCGAGDGLVEGVLRRVDGPGKDQRGLHIQRHSCGSRRPGPRMPRGLASPRLRAVRWPTTSRSTTAPSPTINWWCRRRGMVRRATPRGSALPLKRR